MQRMHCECGGSMNITGPFTEQLIEAFDEMHTGAGHLERVTAPEAAKIREKAREDSRQEYRKEHKALSREQRKQERLAVRRERNEIEHQAILAEERAFAKERGPQ